MTLMRRQVPKLPDQFTQLTSQDPYSARALSTRIAVLQMELNHAEEVIRARGILINNMLIALILFFMLSVFGMFYFIISLMH